MTDKQLFDYLIWIPIGLIILAFMVGVFKYRNLRLSQRLLVVLISAALIAEICSWLLRRSQTNNYPVFHFYAVVEYTLLALFFANQFRQPTLQRALKISGPIMLIYAIANVFVWQGLTTPNTNVTVLSSIIMIVLSISLFFTMINEMRYSRIEKSASFWINVGVLIYFTSSLGMFIYLTWLMPLGYEYTINLLILNIFFNTIHYLCFNIALWMDPE